LRYGRAVTSPSRIAAKFIRRECLCDADCTVDKLVAAARIALAMREAHTGELLYHCWPQQDRQRAYSQFESIINRGFLLTINSAQLDSFAFLGSGGRSERIEVMQKARVCFTEIPLHLLRTHPYGHFAIGFTRKTMVDWGGLPAWYLPNHPGNETLKESAAEIIRGLYASALANENMQIIARDLPKMLKQHIPEEFLSKTFEINLSSRHGPTLSGEKLQNWLGRNIQVMHHILASIKEMSPTDVEDFRHLNEREWRIVAGASIPGEEVCRRLTDDEKEEFGRIRPEWLRELKTSDINVQVRYPPSRVIDHFHFFRGLKTTSVSQMIDTILVPDTAAKRWMKKYIAKHSSAFRPGGPRVRLFPSTRPRLAWLRLCQICNSF
jgi:hypothetical protein